MYRRGALSGTAAAADAHARRAPVGSRLPLTHDLSGWEGAGHARVMLHYDDDDGEDEDERR